MKITSVSTGQPMLTDTNTNESLKSDSNKNQLINTTEALRLAQLRGEKITIGDEQKIKAVDRAIKAMEGPHTTFEFSVHKETNAIMIKVLDKDTGEMIREIPSEKTLDIAAKMMEIAGILIDHKV
ncbi:flagellar protein FlaG [Paenibacillus beijingensis]|nr:flagellar protein FlaG [Paenibacillus beijingensis]